MDVLSVYKHVQWAPDVFIAANGLLLDSCLVCLRSKQWAVDHLTSMAEWIGETWLRVYPVHKRSKIITKYRRCSKDRGKHGSSDQQAYGIITIRGLGTQKTCVLCLPGLTVVSLLEADCDQQELSDLGSGLSLLWQLCAASQRHTEVAQETIARQHSN